MERKAWHPFAWLNVCVNELDAHCNNILSSIEEGCKWQEDKRHTTGSAFDVQYKDIALAYSIYHIWEHDDCFSWCKYQLWCIATNSDSYFCQAGSIHFQTNTFKQTYCVARSYFNGRNERKIAREYMKVCIQNEGALVLLQTPSEIRWPLRVQRSNGCRIMKLNWLCRWF